MATVFPCQLIHLPTPARTHRLSPPRKILFSIFGQLSVNAQTSFPAEGNTPLAASHALVYPLIFSRSTSKDLVAVGELRLGMPEEEPRVKHYSATNPEEMKSKSVLKLKTPHRNSGGPEKHTGSNLDNHSKQDEGKVLFSITLPNLVK